jgi:hypothetical protein
VGIEGIIQWERAMRQRGRPACAALATALLVGWLLAGCATATGGASRAMKAATPLATPALAAAPGPASQLGERARQAIGTLARKIAVQWDAGAQTATITITVAGRVPLTSQQVAAAHELVKLICYKMAAALWSSGVELSAVTLLVLGPMQDAYANIITDWYGVATLKASSAQRIQWASVSADAAWNLYDQQMLRATFDVPDDIPD